MIGYPLLKYSARLRISDTGLEVEYRRRKHQIEANEAELLAAALGRCDGRTGCETLVRDTGVDAAILDRALEQLLTLQVVLDGCEILRPDGNLSGREMFWRLESFLFEWRYESPVSLLQNGFEQSIATGEAPLNLVKGFCLELGYLLRQVPDELSLAVAHSPNESVRSLFMEFYDEESRHGEILFAALQTWFGSPELLLSATPLPATTGLLNTYKAWATRDPLLYATALMRDESTKLDQDIPDNENIYRGMRLFYEVPTEVVDKFEWHANLDRNCEHGFFPEKVFAEYKVISRRHARLLISAMKQIVELHDLFKWNISAYYSQRDVNSRLAGYEAFEGRNDAKFI
jgi:hypothetical protein